MKTIDKDIVRAEKLIKNLISKAGQLPKVDSKGYSECPFAEDLYAYKETAAANLTKAVKILRKRIAPAKKEVDRCRQNLDQISSDSRKLHEEHARADYKNAKKAQLSEYNRAILRSKRLFETLKRAEDELKNAEIKKWPSGDPHAEDRFDPGAVLEDVISARKTGMSYSEYACENPQMPSTGKELNSLMAIGPIGGKLLP